MTLTTTPDGGEPSPRPGTRADFWFGLVLAALGLGIAFEAWRMPTLAELNVEPMTAPGLVPGFLGVVIFALGSILFLRSARAMRQGANSDAENSLAEEEANLSKQTKRFFATLTLCLIYAIGLVGNLPFWLATFLFVSAFICLFEWDQTHGWQKHGIAILTALLQAAVVAFLVSYIFESIFLVRLP